MIAANNIFKTYNNGMVEALKDVSLNIARGEFAVILGASGSGKSTLLNVLSGLEKPDCGTVTVDGRELTAMTDRELTAFRRERVGFVFQQYYLLSHLTVDANIRMGAYLASNRDYGEIVEALGLGAKLDRKPFELSGGEQQRVCIARALAKKPYILFLDEPTGALDEKTGRGVLNRIATEQTRLGFTMLMITHNASIADMSHTVIKMNSGRIAEKYENKVVKTAYEIEW